MNPWVGSLLWIDSMPWIYDGGPYVITGLSSGGSYPANWAPDVSGGTRNSNTITGGRR